MGEVVPARTSPTLHPPSPPTVHQLSWLALLRVKVWPGFGASVFHLMIFLFLFHVYVVLSPYDWLFVSVFHAATSWIICQYNVHPFSAETLMFQKLNDGS